jgi:hypothetical protein
MRKIISVILAFLMMTCVASATISTTANSVSYTCSGSTGPFTFTFPVTPDGTAIVVTETTPASVVTTLTYSTDYTTSPVNASYLNGGSVTLTTACTFGYTLTIQRNTPQTQASSFTDGMPTLYKTFERSLDKLTMITQDKVYQLKGATGATGPQGPAGQSGTGTGDVLGPTTNTADNVPQWNGANSKRLKDGLTVGTAANNLVQLTAAGKYPAVDGSLITGITPASAVKTSGSPLAMAGVTGYYWNNTAAGYEFDLDVPAGQQYCFGNLGTQAQIITIKVNSHSGVYLVYKGVLSTATTGYITSGGGVGDFICMEGADSTHWQITGAGYGTWTLH